MTLIRAEHIVGRQSDDQWSEDKIAITEVAMAFGALAARPGSDRIGFREGYSQLATASSLGQLVTLYDRFGIFNGFFAWAEIDDHRFDRLTRGEPTLRTPEDWRSGGRRWLVTGYAVPGAALPIARVIREDVGGDVHYRRRQRDRIVSRRIAGAKGTRPIINTNPDRAAAAGKGLPGLRLGFLTASVASLLVGEPIGARLSIAGANRLIRAAVSLDQVELTWVADEPDGVLAWAWIDEEAAGILAEPLERWWAADWTGGRTLCVTIAGGDLWTAATRLIERWRATPGAAQRAIWIHPDVTRHADAAWIRVDDPMPADLVRALGPAGTDSVPA